MSRMIPAGMLPSGMIPTGMIPGTTTSSEDDEPVVPDEPDEPTASVVCLTRTRAQIKTFVGHYTGRGTEKSDLIELLCDEALDVALQAHPFKDARNRNYAFELDVGDLTVDLSEIPCLRHVVAATIYDSSGSTSAPLVLKNETWWNEYVGRPQEAQNGWPRYALRLGNTLYLSCPARDGLYLGLIVTTEQRFESDSSVCPIAIASLFVTQYVTAMIFLAVQERDSYIRWYSLALGSQHFSSGRIGGTLGQIISLDKRDIAEQYKALPSNASMGGRGVAFRNLLDGHEDYGNVRLWANG